MMPMPKSIASCKHASRLISEQLDHPLPLSKRILLRIHLAMCTNCVFFRRQVKAIKDLAGARTEPEDGLPSPYTASLSSEVAERIKSLLR